MLFFRYIIIAVLAQCMFLSFGFAAPDVECGGLPGCSDAGVSGAGVYGILWNIIALMIKYVAVIAVIAVMIGWIMYLISSWDEEKTKKAKNVIIWALVGVFISVAAWSIINILNNFRI